MSTAATDLSSPRRLTADEVTAGLRARAYIVDAGLATVLSVAFALRKPLLLEGEAGVGKTECAKAVADMLGTRLIRLQCYEGIDVSHALYDWNYARQMLYIRTLEATDSATTGAVTDVFGRDFMIRRPLLEAIDHQEARAPVLLIDEIDRADDEFEAFLLELLSDFQVTIPEVGTIRARERPVVVLTSNRTRELHDALRRRCLFHWIGYPSVEREIEIVQARLPGVPERLAAEAAAFVAGLREAGLAKAPGLAETLDWVQALCSLDQDDLSPAMVDATLGAVLKSHEDMEQIREQGLDARLSKARAMAGPRR